jgi:hypothetical protein
MIELYYFAVDALVKVVTEDPGCIPLRRFFDEEVRVLSTKQCYDAALDIFLEDRLDRSKATSFFSTYLEKVEMVAASPDEAKDLMLKHSLDEPSASLLAALMSIPLSTTNRGAVHFLVTSDSALISAAQKEGINFHDYTQEQFCAKYGD